MEEEGITDEEKRTLWVGGIDSQVDEEMLYELMLNAGPIESIKIPKDKYTQRSKTFAFVLYQYEESLQYAVDLFCDTRLFGNPLKLQNRKTGVGMLSPYNGRNTNDKINSSEEHSNQNYSSPGPVRLPSQNRNNEVLRRNTNDKINSSEEHRNQNYNSPGPVRLPSQNRNNEVEIESPYDDPRYQNYNSPDTAARLPVQRPKSTPRLQTNQIRASDMQMQQDFQQRQYNEINSPGHLLNMYMNMLSSPDALSSPLGGSSPLGVGFRGLGVNGNRSSQNVVFGNSNYQTHQNHGNFDRGNGGHHSRSSLNYDTENRNRNDRSRSNDTSRSREFNHDRRRR